MWQDPADGVWEISLLGLDVGKYYSFNVDGPTGNGEGFNGLAQIGDPYARAAAHSMNNTIVIDPDETNRWWSGWTDQDYVTRPPQDLVIYEMHVRDLTMHPSSGVAAGAGREVRGPDRVGRHRHGHRPHQGHSGRRPSRSCRRPNSPTARDDYNWGYAPVFYFAPEASYARQPLKGSQYFEFKRLVNELHRRGLGVVLDVVFNHVGSPNIFNLIDKKYFFRLNPDYTFSNFSGCGNDVRTRGADDAAADRGQHRVLDEGVPRRRLPLRPRGADRPRHDDGAARRGARDQHERRPDLRAVELPRREQAPAQGHRLVRVEQRLPLLRQGFRHGPPQPRVAAEEHHGLRGHVGRQPAPAGQLPREPRRHGAGRRALHAAGPRRPQPAGHGRGGEPARGDGSVHVARHPDDLRGTGIPAQQARHPATRTTRATT